MVRSRGDARRQGGADPVTDDCNEVAPQARGVALCLFRRLVLGHPPAR
ncbi:hypothetical protein ACWC2T_35420 [Streptomyces sp. NPDC001393]